MKELLNEVILKYMTIVVENENQNLLDLPVLTEYWLYVIAELEDIYHLPIVQALEHIRYNEFTLRKLSEELSMIKEKGIREITDDEE